MNELLTFVWKENGKDFVRDVDKKAVYSVFEGLAKGFEGDNEISKKLLELIPVADEIIINKDINATQDVPFILINTVNDTKLIKIIRYHKIVWSILNKYCTKE